MKADEEMKEAERKKGRPEMRQDEESRRKNRENENYRVK